METDQQLHLKGKAWLVRWVESRRVQAGSTGRGGCEHGLFSARGGGGPATVPLKSRGFLLHCGACTDCGRNSTDSGPSWKCTEWRSLGPRP